MTTSHATEGVRTTVSSMYHILYLSEKDVTEACLEVNPVAMMKEVFRLHGSASTILPAETYLAWTSENNESLRSLNMPGYLGADCKVAGTKIINSNINNVSRGLPRASGLTVLFDVISGRIRCIMEASHISALRTAAVSTMSFELLRGPKSTTAAIIGAGTVGRAHAALIADQLPETEHIYLTDINPRAAESVADLVRARGLAATVVTTAEQAIRAAQLIVTSTTANTGYIRHDWLQKGAVLVNVSLDDPLKEVVFSADLIFVDDWNLIATDRRRLLGRMYNAGEVDGPNASAGDTSGARRIDGELADILIGRHRGRTRPEEIILVNPFGLSIEDLAIAEQVFEIAQVKGLGVLLDS